MSNRAGVVRIGRRRVDGWCYAYRNGLATVAGRTCRHQRRAADFPDVRWWSPTTHDNYEFLGRELSRMSNGVFQLSMMGRFGNMMFQYAFARAYCEKHGLELQTDQWVGENIFEITPNAIRGDWLPRRCENTLIDGERDVSYRSYSQQQKCLIYTKWAIQRWFKFRPEVEEKLKAYFSAHPHPVMPIVAHRRVGDYLGYGYPVVSKASYLHQIDNLGESWADVEFITEEKPHVVLGIPDEYAFVADFYCMLHAGLLLRGNSCFSWWAGALGNGTVFSPRIDGLTGGREHDVAFEEGNHCRFANFDFTTDLHLQP